MITLAKSAVFLHAPHQSESLIGMAKKPPISDDKRFHYEIWSGPSDEFSAQMPSLQYVENHNADWDYGLAAEDFKMATDALIAEQLKDPHLSNWTAPICSMVRQTMELQLKSLRETVAWMENEQLSDLTFTHNLESLWATGRNWLIENGNLKSEDARLAYIDRLIANLHGIDPTGDLFRFGTSKHHAFDRAKTYDRVGYDQKVFFHEFEQAYQCIEYLASVVLRQLIDQEENDADSPPADDSALPSS